MKVIDIVKPEPKTRLEFWSRWLENMQGKFATAPWAERKIIKVVQLDEDCAGHGTKYCIEQGEHSWFNHSMDLYHERNGMVDNLPAGYVEE